MCTSGIAEMLTSNVRRSEQPEKVSLMMAASVNETFPPTISSMTAALVENAPCRGAVWAVQPAAGGMAACVVWTGGAGDAAHGRDQRRGDADFRQGGTAFER